MFIAPPNNFNQIPMWNSVPMFSEPPTTPMPKFGMDDDTIQTPTMPAPDNNQHREMSPVPPVVNNSLYNQGWLTKQIGKYVKISFLLGTNLYQDRTGIIQEVGISFIVLKEISTSDLIMCDMYSIKFVTVYSNQELKCQT